MFDSTIDRAMSAVNEAIYKRDTARERVDAAQLAYNKADRELREKRARLAKLLHDAKLLDEPATYSSLMQAGCSHHG